MNFRSDERSDCAPADLAADGSPVSETIRKALVGAVRWRRREQVRRESLAVMNDPSDVVESRQVLSDMDELRAW